MISFLLTLACACVPAGAGDFSAYYHNQMGRMYLRSGNKLEAFKAFGRALRSDPLNPAVQLNLAFTFELNEEYAKAANGYDGVLSMNPGAAHEFVAHFNQGNAYAQEKNIPGALKAYQAALDLQPGSEMVKTNIELLFQKGGGQGDGKGKSGENDPKQSKEDDKKDGRTNQEKREDSLKQPQPDQNKDKEKQKAKPFDSKELAPEDVKRILDEIKNQEQCIRAQENDKKPKDGARGGKDW